MSFFCATTQKIGIKKHLKQIRRLFILVDCDKKIVTRSQKKHKHFFLKLGEKIMDAPTIHISRQSGEFQIPAFDAVIPATVRYDSRLSGDAKILYAEVRALTNAYGFCWAGDEYFCNLFNVSYKTIGRWLAQLEDAGHIVITKERDDTDGKLYRIIRLSEAVQGPLEQKMDKVVQNSGQSCPKKMDKSVHSNSNNKYIKNIDARARVTQKKSTVKNQFNNFSQRNYNMDQLEAAIINRPMRASP